MLGHITLHPAPDQLLDALQREGRGGQIATRLRHRGLHHRLRLHHFGRIADFLGFGGLQERARIEQPQRPMRTDQARQQPASGAGVRHQATMGEVPGKPAAVRNDPHIALAGELRAHADGDPIDGGDHRLWTLHDRPPLLALVRPPAHAARFAGNARQIRQIGAGAKRPAAAGDDQHPHPIIRSGLPHGAYELAQHGIGHRIALFRPINGDHADPVGVDIVADVVFGHGRGLAPSENQ